jgi:hypothetical protein
MPRILVRLPFADPKGGDALSFSTRLQPPFYRRAGLVIPVGHESVHDVTDAQLEALRDDALLEVVAPFEGDAASYPKALPAGIYRLPTRSGDTL